MADMNEVVTRARARQVEEEATEPEEDVDDGAPSLEDLAAKSIKCVLTVRGIKIKAEVDTDAMAIRPMKAFARLSRDEGTVEDLDELTAFLVRAIRKWDLRESRKSADLVAITQERLSELGIPLVGGIMEALMAAMRMGEESGKSRKRPLSGTRARGQKPYYAR